PIPMSLLKQCCHILAPVITNIVNLSLSTCEFPSQFKHAIVTPLIKKPSLDRESLSNYRPISNLSFISKLTERVIKDRLHEHLSHNSMFNIFQSAYTKFHSTESALLVIHDHLIKAMDRQEVTGLILLDLSIGCFRHNRPLHPTPSPHFLAWYMRQCSPLVPVISILQILFCLLSRQPLLFTASFLW